MESIALGIGYLIMGLICITLLYAFCQWQTGC